MVFKFRLGDYWKGQGNLFIQSDGSLMGRSTPYQYFKRHLKRYNEWVANSDEAKQNGWSTLPMIPLHGLRHTHTTLFGYILLVWSCCFILLCLGSLYYLPN